MRGYKKRQLFCIFGAAVCVALLPIASHALTITHSGDMTVTALVPTPPPSTAPTIDSPVDNESFTVKNILISGSCVTNLVVRIFDNSQFVGSSVCASDGTYQLSADLSEGANELTAKQYDALNQPSPPSAPITVFFAPPASVPSFPPSGQVNVGQPQIATFELKIDYDYLLQSVFVGEPYYLPVHFIGGTPPYAVNIDWGDGQNGLFSRPNTDQFTTQHTYARAGAYTVKIKVSDSKGQQAYIQFVLIVNGAPALGVVQTPFGDIRTIISVPALILTIIILLLLGFIIGFLIARRSSDDDDDKKKRRRQLALFPRTEEITHQPEAPILPAPAPVPMPAPQPPKHKKKHRKKHRHHR
ncbi:MAG TPA: PKD domain-containing protein [Candidatus Acidoferrum sp.]|nr:PKD domain-containing protein [Candidatus Acidoferrum sp.]